MLAGLARGSLRRKGDKLAEVVPGLIRDHYWFLLQRHLGLIDELSRQIQDVDGRIEEGTRPFSALAPAAREHSGPSDIGRLKRSWPRSATMTCRGPPRQPILPLGRGCVPETTRAPASEDPRTGKGNGWLRDALLQVAWASAGAVPATTRTVTACARWRPKMACCTATVARLGPLRALWRNRRLWSPARSRRGRVGVDPRTKAVN